MRSHGGCLWHLRSSHARMIAFFVPNFPFPNFTLFILIVLDSMTTEQQEISDDQIEQNADAQENELMALEVLRFSCFALALATAHDFSRPYSTVNSATRAQTQLRFMGVSLYSQHWAHQLQLNPSALLCLLIPPLPPPMMFNTPTIQLQPSVSSHP